MAEIVKRVGQVTGATIPSGATLYTVGTGVNTVIASISVCNRKGSGTSVTMWHVDGAFGDRADEDVFAFNHNLLSFATVQYNLKICMEVSDTIIVKTSGSTYVTFIAWGSEQI